MHLILKHLAFPKYVETLTINKSSTKISFELSEHVPDPICCLLSARENYWIKNYGG